MMYVTGWEGSLDFYYFLIDLCISLNGRVTEEREKQGSSGH